MKRCAIGRLAAVDVDVEAGDFDTDPIARDDSQVTVRIEFDLLIVGSDGP